MARLNLGLIVLVLVAGNVAGCKPAIEADLSPDGKTAAITRDRALVFHDTTGLVSDRLVSLKGPESPIFSPDGKWVVVAVGKKTYLVEESTGYLSSIPPISPPFTWKPDGTELCGIRKNQAVVVHIASREICRQYTLPDEPQHAIWLGTGRDLAFSSNHKLMSIFGGKVQSQEVDGAIMSIAQNGGRDSLRYSIAYERLLAKGMPGSEIQIREVSADLTSPTKLLWKARDPACLGVENRFCLMSQSELSPNGRYVINDGGVDQSKPGLLQKYADLGGFDQRKIDKKKRELFKKMEMQMRFAFVASVADLNDANPHANHLFFEKSDHSIECLFWSKDSQKVGLLIDDKLILKPIL